MDAAPIRRLTADDIAAHRNVLSLYAKAFDDDDSYLTAQPDDSYLRDLLARPDFIEVAAFDGDAVVGALSGYVLPKFEQARSEIYIYDLAVAETHRRRGIAESLVAALNPIAREAGVWVIYVQADYGDEPAIALYTKLGAREDVMHFDISPSGTSVRD